MNNWEHDLQFFLISKTDLAQKRINYFIFKNIAFK